MLNDWQAQLGWQFLKTRRSTLLAMWAECHSWFDGVSRIRIRPYIKEGMKALRGLEMKQWRAHVPVLMAGPVTILILNLGPAFVLFLSQLSNQSLCESLNNTRWLKMEQWSAHVSRFIQSPVTILVSILVLILVPAFVVFVRVPKQYSTRNRTMSWTMSCGQNPSDQ